MDEICNLFQGNQVANELEAYLLGFFYADGCVSKLSHGSYRMFSISLAEKDRDYLQWILDVINECLHTEYTLKYVPANKAYRLAISKKVFVNRLIKLGVTNNKTYENNAFVFDNIPTDLKRHFIRGYFDGDGCISFYKQKNRCYVGIVSLNSQLITAIQEYVYGIFKFGSIRMDQQYSRYQICGNVSTKKFLDWIYKDSNFYMQRKYDKYLQIPPKQRRNIYKGICREKRSPNNLYNVRIYYDGKSHYIGSFYTIREAVNAYNVVAEQCGVEQQQYKGEELYYE